MHACPLYMNSQFTYVYIYTLLYISFPVYCSPTYVYHICIREEQLKWMQVQTPYCVPVHTVSWCVWNALSRHISVLWLCPTVGSHHTVLICGVPGQVKHDPSTCRSWDGSALQYTDGKSVNFRHTQTELAKTDSFRNYRPTVCSLLGSKPHWNGWEGGTHVMGSTG